MTFWTTSSAWRRCKLPPPHGERDRTGRCKECARLKSKRWRQKEMEKRKERLRCKSTDHEKYPDGKCRTCSLARKKEQRDARRALKENLMRGHPLTAALIQGHPCRVCGSTTRYAVSHACVSCQRERTKKRSMQEPLRIPKEYLSWISTPLPEGLNEAQVQSPYHPGGFQYR